MEAQLRELGVKELKRRAKELGCDEEKIGIARADHWKGPYRRLLGKPILPNLEAEDPCASSCCIAVHVLLPEATSLTFAPPHPQAH